MSSSADTPRMTEAEAEAIATAVALHHLRASQSGGGEGVHADLFSPWAREALLTSVDKNLHRMTAWGVRTWG